MTTPEGQRAGETMKFGEWEPVLRDDPRGQPVPYYRGLVCLVAHGENIISVVTKDGSSIPSECWDDVAKLVASAPTLATENARLTERVKVLEAALEKIACWGVPFPEESLGFAVHAVMVAREAIPERTLAEAGK